MKTKEPKLVAQQGDTLYFRTDVVEGEPLETNVIQEGESTGHAHRITSGVAELFGAPDGRKFMRVGSTGATITHEEHLPVTIEEGDYEVKIIRQKDIFSKLISKVVD